MKLTELPKGTIFKWANKSWEALERIHSVTKEGNRYLIILMGIGFAGNVDKAFGNSFTWRDEDVEVFVPKFYLCEFKKTRGIPCIPVNNHRQFLPNNLNELNMSDVYCSRNDYWYEYVNENENEKSNI